MTSSPGSCLHHLHIPCCSEISQVTRPEGEGNTGLSAQCHTFCTEKTTPWAPCSGLPPVKVGSLFLGATRGCREWVCTVQVETSLWGVGEKPWGSVSESAIFRVNLVLGVDPAVHRRSGRGLTSLSSAPEEEEGQREEGWRIFSERLPRHMLLLFPVLGF